MPHKILKIIVIFVGLSQDHRKVLCFKNGERLEPPYGEFGVSEQSQSEAIALSMRDAYMLDKVSHRELAFAYSTMSIPRTHGSAAILTHAQIVDGHCWMRVTETGSAYEGIWIPYRELLRRDRPLAVRKAIIALKRKHHLV